MRIFLGQAILHALVAAVVIEALVRIWRIPAGRHRLDYRLLALALPLASDPVLAVVAPFRSGTSFTERWTLFSLTRWAQIPVAGYGLDSLLLVVLAAVGIGLFLLDLVPALTARSADRTWPVADDHTADLIRRRVVETLVSRLGIPEPDVRVVQTSRPVLLCTGVRRFRLILSTGAVASLDEVQLRAAIAHELAHAAHRDPLGGWVLMGIRTAFFFSPATQLLARATVEEMERRADDESVALTGDRLGMASALVRLFAVQHPDAAPPEPFHGDLRGSIEAWFHRGRATAVEHRCRRLLAATEPQTIPLARARVVLAGISVVILLFFVV